MSECERDRLIAELGMTAFALGERAAKANTLLDGEVWEILRQFILVMIDELNFQRQGWCFDLKDVRRLLEVHSMSRVARLGGMTRIRLP